MKQKLTGIIVLIAITFGFGQTWTVQSSGTTENLNAVCFLNADTGWAVGNKGTILKYAGSQWSTGQSGTTSNLNEVVLLSGHEGWAVGDSGTLLKYDGTGWKVVPFPVKMQLVKIDFISATKGFIVADSVTNGWNKILFSLNGEEWKRENLSSITGEPTGYSQGFLCTSYSNNYKGKIFNFTNNTWAEFPNPDDDHEGLVVINMQTASRGIIVDVMGSTYLSSGTTWTRKYLGAIYAYDKYINNFWWANEGIHFYFRGQNSLYEYRNDTAKVLKTGTVPDSQITDLSIIDDTTIVAVGKTGRILRLGPPPASAGQFRQTTTPPAPARHRESIVMVPGFQAQQKAIGNRAVFDCTGRKVSVPSHSGLAVQKTLSPGIYLVK